MQVLNIAAGHSVRHILRCSRHGQIRYQPPRLPPGIAVNLPQEGGTYSGGATGWAIMRRDFQAHREDQR
jgi:hypothetical protein